jgi:DNA-binding IscR family transcriptional regulator
MDTHHELAAEMGVRQDHLSRIIARFHREGLIHSHPHRRGVIILDPDRLRSFGD